MKYYYQLLPSFFQLSPKFLFLNNQQMLLWVGRHNPGNSKVHNINLWDKQFFSYHAKFGFILNFKKLLFICHSLLIAELINLDKLKLCVRMIVFNKRYTHANDLYSYIFNLFLKIIIFTVEMDNIL